MKDYYEILEISKSASEETIKAAYRTMAKKYHPDVYKGSKEDASKKMTEINLAFEVLSDPQQRKIYDDEQSQKNNNQSSTTQSHVDETPKEEASQTEIKKTDVPEQSDSTPQQKKEQSIFEKIIEGIIGFLMLGFMIFAIIKWGIPFVCNSSTSTSITSGNTISDFEENTPEYFVSVFLESTKLNSDNAIDPESVGENLKNEVSSLRKEIDSLYNQQELQALRFLTDNFVDKLFQQCGNISYEISPARHDDENTTTISVVIYFTDLQALLNEIDESMEFEFQRSINLGITPDIQQLYPKYFNQHLPKFEKQSNCAINFVLEKISNTKWKIISCSDTKKYLNAISGNILKLN